MVVKFVILYLMVMNVIAFGMYGIDKKRARRRQWRISERTLLMMAAAGGSVGALLGMNLFHHKTRHLQFAVGVPVILAVQIAAAVCVKLLLN